MGSNSVSHETQTDAKTRITAWAALVWAYQRECVRIITGMRDRARGYGGSSMISIENALNNCSPGGTIHEPPSPPKDATDIDDFVKAHVADYAQYMVIAAAAESGVPISLDVEKPPLRPKPKEPPRWRTFMGEYCLLAPAFIHPVNRRPWFTPVMWVGFSEEDLAKLRELQARRYELLATLLGVMEAHLTLERYVIQGVGLTACDESLTKASTLSAVRPEV